MMHAPEHCVRAAESTLDPLAALNLMKGAGRRATAVPIWEVRYKIKVGGQADSPVV